jgi:hypothetical protein
VSFGTDPGYTPHELSQAVKIAKIRFVIAEPVILPNIMTALRENGLDAGQRLFVLDTQPGQWVPSGLKSWRKLLNHGLEDWIRFDDRAESQKMARL